MLKRRAVSLVFFFFISATLATSTFSANEPAGFEGLDEFIAGVMGQWKVPGLAIAVVKDGEVILSRGYGFRDVENKLLVTPRTLFAIGSITKSFTVVGLGMLVDEGALEWDKPIRDYLPDFQLRDPVAARQMTARDLVTHRSGLPRHDGMWYGASLTREELFKRLRYLEPNEEFRSTWQYQNLMFMTAGYLTGRLSGISWEEFTRKRILEPLGMRASNFSIEDSQKADDYSLPYDLDDDKKVVKVPFRNIDEIGPAGSINSNVEEMIHYVRFHIDKGQHGDERILSISNAEQMQTPQMVIPGDIDYDELGHSSYGMGFVVTSYRGHKLVQHGGGIDGFISLLSFMPRKQMGMIVLTNSSGNNPVPTIVTRNLYDRLLGLEQVPWAERVKIEREKTEAAEEEAKKKGYVPRKEGTRPTHALSDYAGTYEHPAYGSVRVDLSGETLEVSFHGASSTLEHFHYDIFEAPKDPLNSLGGTKVTFLYDKKGDIDGLAMPMEPRVDDIVFHRVADPSMREGAFLEPFVGEYELGPTTIEVSLQGGDTLMILTEPGQPIRELVPTRGTSFDVQGRTGYSVEFKKDEIVLHQPAGSFVGKKK